MELRRETSMSFSMVSDMGLFAVGKEFIVSTSSLVSSMESWHVLTLSPVSDTMPGLDLVRLRDSSMEASGDRWVEWPFEPGLSVAELGLLDEAGDILDQAASRPREEMWQFMELWQAFALPRHPDEMTGSMEAVCGGVSRSDIHRHVAVPIEDTELSA